MVVTPRETWQPLQQLLIAAGESVAGGPDGKWGPNTAKALAAFQQRNSESRFITKKPYVDPNDELPLLAAWRARILIPMPKKSGIAGVKQMHKWFYDNKIKYNPGAERKQGNRSIYGVYGRTQYAIQRTSQQFLAGPVEMDCTVYANLMLSIYMNGHIHSAPYDARCGHFGGVSASHLARDRYQLPLVRRPTSSGSVNWFGDAEQLTAAIAAKPNGLYAIECADKGSGSVYHMGIMHDDTAYECTTGQSGSSCISKPLKEFTVATERRKKGIFYLFGPHPVGRF
jgi:hypothetical protein